MLIKTAFELEIEQDEYDEIVNQIVMCMGKEIERIGKFDLAYFTREEFERVAQAAFSVSAATVFGRRVNVIPPFEVQVLQPPQRVVA